MSGALLLEPHQDDAVLFASFTLIEHRPTVVTVFGDSRCHEQHGVNGATRNAENEAAFAELTRGEARRIDTWQLPFVDVEPYPGVRPEIEEAIRVLAADPEFGHIFAPWPENGGHALHNVVGEIAARIFPPERLSFYTTYRYGGPKTREGSEVEPRPEWIIRKLRALACYESQILYGPRRFFMEDLREYRLDGMAARRAA